MHVFVRIAVAFYCLARERSFLRYEVGVGLSRLFLCVVIYRWLNKALDMFEKKSNRRRIFEYRISTLYKTLAAFGICTF